MSVRRFALASITTAILLLVVLTPLVSLVRAPPPAPFTTFGRAFFDNGAPMPVGMPIRTFIDGVDYSNLTSVYRADGSYVVDTLGNFVTPSTPAIKEGGDAGDPIMYTPGDLTGGVAQVFNETGTWSTAGFQNQDLHQFPRPPASPKIHSITTRPGDGGNQYVWVCNPSGIPVDTTDYYLQKDGLATFNGPILPLGSGFIMIDGGRFYMNLGSTSWLTATGDALKLVWDNPGPGGANGGADVIVDRVEFNASAGGTLDWEPGNTVMTDAPAPGLGQEIHRDSTCTDTNAGADFTIGGELGRAAPPAISVSYPTTGTDLTGGTRHRIDWNMTSIFPDNTLVVNVSYSLDGSAYTEIARDLTKTDPSTIPWDVPFANVTTARVMVCARDLATLLGCGASPPFTIDSARPVVLATDPLNGVRGVPLDKVIVFVFTEDMRTSGTDVTITPAAGTLSFNWPGPRSLEVSHATLFAGCTNYDVSIGSGFSDDSLPGNALVPMAFSFFSICAPTVTLQGPVGGEDFTGGSAQYVRWFMTDEQTNPLLATWVNLSTNSGATFATVIAGLSMRTEGNVAVPWTVNLFDTTTARVQVCVQDETFETTCASSPADFEIDSTAPTVVSVTPANGANQVMPTDVLRITFSESMNTTSVSVIISPDPGGIVPSWNSPTDTVLTLAHNPFSGGPFTVTIVGTSKDVSDPGNPLGTDYIFTFSLNTAPQVVIVDPVQGACWCGGTSHPIALRLRDTESGAGSLRVWLNASIGPPIIAGSTNLPDPYTFSWVAPTINDSNFVLVATVFDPRGLFAQDSVTIKVDTIKPTLLSATPANSATGVALNQVIRLEFSKPMDKSETENATSILPNLPGKTVSWSGDTLIISHSGFASATPYTITITTRAKDTCDPGNALAPATITFTTASNNPPTVAFTAPVNAETWNVGDSRRISWSMSDETPEAQLRVWLNYSSPAGSGNLVNGLAGVTSYDWSVPSTLAGSTVTFHLDVVDAQGAKTSKDSVTVSIAGGGGGLVSDIWPWLLLIIVVVVIVALLLFFVLRRRKKEPEVAAPVKAPAKPAAKPPVKPAARPPVKVAPKVAPKPVAAPKPAPAPVAEEPVTPEETSQPEEAVQPEEITEEPTEPEEDTSTEETTESEETEEEPTDDTTKDDEEQQ